MSPEKVIAGIQEHKPDIVGFSAFLTTTMPMFKANINALQKAGLRDQVIVMVGGAPVTQEYADAVGADGYARMPRPLCARPRRCWPPVAPPPRCRTKPTVMTSPIEEPDPLDQGSGPVRVRIHFEPDGANPRDVRVPAGVSVFDAASWNGIAIDSTCGGHGTCRKCKIRVLDGAVPVSRLDPRAFDPEQLTAGWRLACMASAEHDIRVHVPPLVTRPRRPRSGSGGR